MSTGWIGNIAFWEEEEVANSSGKCFDGDIDFNVEDETVDFSSAQVDKEADEDFADSTLDISMDFRLTTSWLEKWGAFWRSSLSEQDDGDDTSGW